MCPALTYRALSCHPVIQSSSHPVIQSSSHPVIQSSSHHFLYKNDYSHLFLKLMHKNHLKNEKHSFYSYRLNPYDFSG
ncbi:hypothetical protein FIU11_07250 [Vibrio furnissii]|nr:hypothetical protein FIU11_07250 [Vibrio furnissii]